MILSRSFVFRGAQSVAYFLLAARSAMAAAAVGSAASGASVATCQPPAAAVPVLCAPGVGNAAAASGASPVGWLRHAKHSDSESTASSERAESFMITD